MRKFYTLALAALVLMVGACDTKRQKEDAEKAREFSKADSLQLVINQMRNESEDLNDMKMKISDIMRQINEAEGRINNASVEGSENQVIIENMAFIQQKMNEYRKMVEAMRQQLRNSNQISKKEKKNFEADIAAYQEQLKQKDQEIASLREELAQRDIIITEQSAQLAEQTDKVNNLAAENAAKEQAILEQDRKLHTAWYVFGTKRELKEEKILVKGEVMKSNEVNKDYFTEIDIRVIKTIPLHSKDAELLTTHPADSYNLDKDANGMYTLRITQPDKFWSVNKYLVILVK
ncbi:lipoprotein [gut metagenome]|uniref:Lipoprotein n=1 Tax=gut metagenome TaxID=749906 RepID=J9G5I2_9ZZZZ